MKSQTERILLIQQVSWLQAVYALNGLLMMGLAGVLALASYRHVDRHLSLHL